MLWCFFFLLNGRFTLEMADSVGGKEKRRCGLREGASSSRIADECSESTPREETIPHSMNKEKKKRGKTTLQVIPTGEKYRKEVEWNESGQPVGEVSIRFSTTLGVIVRECVPINIESWDKVTPPIKNRAWTLLMVI